MAGQLKQQIIFAFGFDRLGFTTPTELELSSEIKVRFISYESEISFEDADGLIIPSGIFERFGTQDGFMNGPRRVVFSDEDRLAVRLKQLLNASKKGVWAAFLVGSVENGHERCWDDTDLAKRLLNMFCQEVVDHPPISFVDCRDDQFRKYCDRFGIAQTTFVIEEKNLVELRIIATARDLPVAIAFRGKLFFVPFLTDRHDRATLGQCVELIATAVLAHKRKHDLHIPGWINNLRFITEEKIENEIGETEKKLLQLEADKDDWKSFKAILSTSGPTLNQIVVKVLRQFFSLPIKSEEKYADDACILGDDGTISHVIEIKGVNGGLKREHINQLDSHREKLNVKAEIPGILIINDFMDIEDFAERKKKNFDQNHLRHAFATNVKVLRTTTLFEWMLFLEGELDRKTRFLATLRQTEPLIASPQ